MRILLLIQNNCRTTPFFVTKFALTNGRESLKGCHDLDLNQRYCGHNAMY